jgi:hypothetical protein
MRLIANRLGHRSAVNLAKSLEHATIGYINILCPGPVHFPLADWTEI